MPLIPLKHATRDQNNDKDTMELALLHSTHHPAPGLLAAKAETDTMNEAVDHQWQHVLTNDM